MHACMCTCISFCCLLHLCVLVFPSAVCSIYGAMVSLLGVFVEWGEAHSAAGLNVAQLDCSSKPNWHHLHAGNTSTCAGWDVLARAGGGGRQQGARGTREEQISHHPHHFPAFNMRTCTGSDAPQDLAPTCLQHVHMRRLRCTRKSWRWTPTAQCARCCAHAGHPLPLCTSSHPHLLQSQQHKSRA